MKRALLVIVLVLLTDQVLKVWVKTHFFLGEYIPMFGDNSSWAYLQFVENKGMAFGLEFGGEAGKLLLTLFRMVAVVAIGWVLRWMVREKQSGTRIISLALIFAGALGNIIDSAFYGMIFNDSTDGIARFLPPDGGYAGFLQGRVVDMLYFPLVSGRFPDWLPIWGGETFLFFRPVFNIADASISIGVILYILFQKRFHEGDHAQKTETDAPGATDASSGLS